MIRIAMIVVLMAAAAFGANTNKADNVEKVEKERKAEHSQNKIIVKSRAKGSTKESDWQTEREYPLMFANNRKAKKNNTKKETK